MSDGRAPHPFEGSEPPPDEFNLDVPDIEEDLSDEASFYKELPEDWDVDEPEEDILDDEPEEDILDDEPEEDILDDEPEIVAEVDDGDITAGPGATSVIVLNGPRAGSIVSPADGLDVGSSGSRRTRKVSSVSTALAPGEVLMLVHRPGRYFARMPHALAHVHADFSHTGLHLGISASLPRAGAIKTKEYLDRCGAAAVRIADPEGYALPSDLINDPALTPTQLNKVGYVDPAVAPAGGAASTATWNKQVIQSQRAAGANVLLTPGRSLDPADPQSALEEACRSLDVLLGEVDASEVPAWNLTLPAAWLATPTLRRQLLAELVDRDDVNVWHVRVRWPQVRPYRAFSQLQAEDLLEGYRELAATARREDRALLLPNTGLTGWMTLGWGSAGFGTGSSQTTQGWADTPRITTKKGVKRTTVHRHLVAPLLHTITLSTHQALARTLPSTTYPACPCTFCAAQAQAPTWQPEVDAGHTIYAMGALAAEAAATPRRDRATRIKQLVGDTHTLQANLPAGALDVKESPEHLAFWDKLLS